MSRAATFFGTLGFALAAWTFLVFFDSKNILGLGSDVQSVIVALPAYALMVFGCYALFTIGSELFNYRDCDDAAVELKEQIKVIKADLKAQNFKF